MSKRGPTRAQQVLIEANLRIQKAEGEVNAAYRELDAKRAVLLALRDGYGDLERTLTAPRKKREPQPPPEQKIPTDTAKPKASAAKT